MSILQHVFCACLQISCFINTTSLPPLMCCGVSVRPCSSCWLTVVCVDSVCEVYGRSWSPLTEEGYAEKLRLLREAASIPMERWRAPTVLAWLEIALGMPQYGPRCAENVKSGKVFNYSYCIGVCFFNLLFPLILLHSYLNLGIYSFYFLRHQHLL